MKLEYIFANRGQVIVNLKLSIAGVRLIGIDGGGVRGVTPLEFIGELQRLIRDYQLHKMIDLALGTSSSTYPLRSTILVKLTISR